MRHSKLGHWLLDNEIVRHCLHLLLRVTFYGILLTFLIYGKSGKVCSPIPFQNRRFCHSFGKFRWWSPHIVIPLTGSMKLFPIFGWIIFLSNPWVGCDKRSANGIFEKFCQRNWDIDLDPNDLFQGRSVHGGDIISSGKAINQYWKYVFPDCFVRILLRSHWNKP